MVEREVEFNIYIKVNKFNRLFRISKEIIIDKIREFIAEYFILYQINRENPFYKKQKFYFKIYIIDYYEFFQEYIINLENNSKDIISVLSILFVYSLGPVFNIFLKL